MLRKNVNRAMNENKYSSAAYPCGSMNFHRRIDNLFPNSHNRALTALGKGGFFQKISAPHFLTKLRSNLILTGSIPLDSTSKKVYFPGDLVLNFSPLFFSLLFLEFFTEDYH
jgi:hypothetical protein